MHSLKQPQLTRDILSRCIFFSLFCNYFLDLLKQLQAFVLCLWEVLYKHSWLMSITISKKSQKFYNFYKMKPIGLQYTSFFLRAFYAKSNPHTPAYA